jgi:hypothetical protein
VAAKAQDIFDDCRSSMVRRSVRMRRGSSLSKPAPLFIQSLKDSSIQTTTLCSPRINSSSPPSPVVNKPESFHPIEFEVDSDTVLEVDRVTDGSLFLSSEREGIALPTARSPCFTDFSNFLGTSLQNERGVNLSSDIQIQTDCSGDRYGWEAELQRQKGCGAVNTEDRYSWSGHPFTGPDGCKRKSLLHRLFQTQMNRRVSSA